MSAEVPTSSENLLQIAGCIAALFLQDLRAPPEMTEANVEAWLRWSKRVQAHAVGTFLPGVFLSDCALRRCRECLRLTFIVKD